MARPARWRVAAFWIFVAICVAGVIYYIRERMPPPASLASVPLYDPAHADDAAAIDRLRVAPFVMVVSTRAGAFGHVGVTDGRGSADPLLLTTPECERAHFAANTGLCLELNRDTMSPRAFARIVDRQFRVRASLPLQGLPIRARVSADERIAVATVFVTGESYASDFTTRTTLIDLQTNSVIADLEQFTTERDGKVIKEIDFNFWGVTFFQDSNRFYATLGTGGKRFLVEGDIARRHMRVVRDDVECPSLSPDERRIVFKRAIPDASGWRLWVLDLASGEEWPVTPGSRQIDDQAEWLDNDRVLYGVQFASGIPEHALSIWVSDVSQASGFDERVFVRSALSPSVVR